MLKGLDVSHFQGDINFDTLKPNVNFIIVKSSEGVGYKDDKLERNKAEARRVGLSLGFYHFARPDLSNASGTEADFFLNCVGDLNDGDILVLDFEVKYANPVVWCREFLDHVHDKLGGYKPLIYLNQNLNNTLDWSSVVNAGYGLWLADYDQNSDPTVVPKTDWPVVAIKQWSSTQTFPGINGNVDADSFNGDATALKAYGYHKVAPPTPPTPSPINDQTKLPILFPNGQEMELQAVRSELYDGRKIIESDKTKIADLVEKVAAYSAKVGELTNAINDPASAENPTGGYITQITNLTAKIPPRPPSFAWAINYLFNK